MGNVPRDRNSLRRRAYRSVAIFIVVLAVCLFLPALALAWWQAWTYVLVFAGTAFAATLYLLVHDPELVAHWLRAGPTAEKESQQKRIQGVLSVVFVLLLVVPGLDHFFGWSRVSNAAVLAADVAVVVGFWIVFRTFQADSFASSIVEVREGQRVVTTGPYAAVRRPMYAGALLLILATPLALGSWWGSSFSFLRSPASSGASLTRSGSSLESFPAMPIRWSRAPKHWRRPMTTCFSGEKRRR